MMPEQQAPVILEAMTLRGVGSYLRGARLEIKPLTILCGTNGSGKSTWLKVLHILDRSVDSKRLPYGFDVADWNPQDIQFTNAFYHLAPPSEFEAIDGLTANELYGPPGTVGLELSVQTDYTLPPLSSVASHIECPVWEFLCSGKCKAGTKFRIRLAHPTYYGDTQQTPGLSHLIELVLDDKFAIRMASERDPFQKFEDGFSRPRRSKPYTLSCSRSIVSSDDGLDFQLIDVALVRDLNAGALELLRKDLDASLVGSLFDLFDKRLQQLIRIALDGFFYIGAIRQPYLSTKLTTIDDVNVEAFTARRRVGVAGEHAWHLERQYGSDVMQAELAPNPEFRPGDVDKTCIVALCLCIYGNSWDSPWARKLSRVWDNADQDKRVDLEALAHSVGGGAYLEEATQETLQQSFVGVLNSALASHELFDVDVWTHEETLLDVDGQAYVDQLVDIADPSMASTIESLLNNGAFESWYSNEKWCRYLNYHLILDAFHDFGSLVPSYRCTFDEYLSLWLQHLVDVGIQPAKYSLPNMGINDNQWTRIMFRGLGKANPRTPYLTTRRSHESTSRPSMARLSHPCFGKGELGTIQPPRQLSAGFHQMFPILVQLGLMRKGELLGLENPEVHFHPALQLRVTECLLNHVLSGRRVIVETHSDLVLRRVIRAILEEQVWQSKTQIYFVDLSEVVTTSVDGRPIEFRGSSLEQIRVDERGRIANWPEGFLDDDVRESQRLLDIMYGNMNPDEDDANDDES